MPRVIRRVCVFCGANTGIDPAHREAAIALGRRLAARGQELVYGGGQVGLMGVLADAVLGAGGRAIGVLPEILATKELAHPGLTEMRIVPGMHARKALMMELTDAFVALPGGFGTFDELFEAITWAQLGIHAKPIGVLDVAGYFDPFVRLVDGGIAAGFIRPEHRGLLVVGRDPEALLEELARHELPAVRKWADPEPA